MNYTNWLWTESVVFYKAGSEIEPTTAVVSLVGRNFFTEVANFENIEEFRRRFGDFVEGRQSVNSFTINSSRSENKKLLRAMLVRLSEGNRDERKKFVLADLRPA